jgi:hypothetical protein
MICVIAQLDAGDVTMWCQSIKTFSGVAWPNLGGRDVTKSHKGSKKYNTGRSME